MKKLMLTVLFATVLFKGTVSEANTNQCEASVSIISIDTPATFKDARLGEHNQPLFIDGIFTITLGFTYGDTSTVIDDVSISFGETVLYNGQSTNLVSLGSVSNSTMSKTYVGFEIPSSSLEYSSVPVEVTISAHNETDSCEDSSSSIVDYVGNLSTLTLYDTGDPNFSNFFKQETNEWLVDNVIRKVNSGSQKSILTQQTSTTLYIESWRDSVDKFAFPLTATNNKVLSIGYNSYFSLYSTGNYTGETQNNEIEIRPRYYALSYSSLTPLDVYVDIDNKQRLINDFDQPKTDFEWLVEYDYGNEKSRRMMTNEIISATESFTSLTSSNVYQGTTNKLYLRAKSRSYLGTRNKVRWDFTIGLPSSAYFKTSGTDEVVTPEYVVCTLQVVAKGDLWNMYYDNSSFITDSDITITDHIKVSSRALYNSLVHNEEEIPVLIISGRERSSDSISAVGAY